MLVNPFDSTARGIAEWRMATLHGELLGERVRLPECAERISLRSLAGRR